jgi:hypothetical protein
MFVTVLVVFPAMAIKTSNRQRHPNIYQERSLWGGPNHEATVYLAQFAVLFFQRVSKMKVYLQMKHELNEAQVQSSGTNLLAYGGSLTFAPLQWPANCHPIWVTGRKMQ